MDEKDQKPLKIETFEDLLNLAGTKGYINYAIFIVASLTALIDPLQAFSYQFIGATPDYRCLIPQLRENNFTTEQIQQIAIPYTLKNSSRQGDARKEYSKCDMYDLDYDILSRKSFDDALGLSEDGRSDNKIIQCRSREFDTHVESTVTKWDLVCERRAIYSTTQAAVQGGWLVGSLFYGYLIDRFGRAKIYNICVVLSLLCGYISVFSTSIEMFIIIKVLRSIIGMGIYMPAFVLAMELCSLKQRTLVGNYIIVPWAFGIMMTAGIAYAIRPWRWLEAALTTPAVILLAGIWIMPESPRWLIIKGRFTDAYKVLENLAAGNKKELPSKQELMDAMEKIKEMNTEKEVTTTKKSIPCFSLIQSVGVEFFKLIKDPKLRRRTFAMFFCWFSASMVYYGVSLVSPALSTDPYFYLFLGGLTELPCYILLWPIVAWMGRKKAVVMFYFLCTLGILSMMFMIIYTDKEEYVGLKTGFSLIGKFGITAAFHLLWVYTAELYPTEMRTMAISSSSALSRVGSITSPYISDLLGENTVWVPSALFSFFSVAAGCVAMVLPETSGKNLPDSVEQAADFKQESSKDNPGFKEEGGTITASERL